MLKVYTLLLAAFRRTKFASFPEVLVVHAKKFQLIDWVPAKLGMCSGITVFLITCVTQRNCVDIPILLPPGDALEFGEKHLGRGLQPSETELPNDTPSLPLLSLKSRYQLA